MVEFEYMDWINNIDKTKTGDVVSGKDAALKAERGKYLCEKALRMINGKRQDQYGDPEDSFGLIAEYWSTYIGSMVLHDFNICLESKDVAHMMVLLKIARMQGKENKEDNYVDAIGYIALAGEM